MSFSDTEFEVAVKRGSLRPLLFARDREWLQQLRPFLNRDQYVDLRRYHVYGWQVRRIARKRGLSPGQMARKLRQMLEAARETAKRFHGLPPAGWEWRRSGQCWVHRARGKTKTDRRMIYGIHRMFIDGAGI
jgi:AraC-like DNA-binding protein